MTVHEVKGYVCPECDQLFDEPGPAVYECSRCGSQQVEERRCMDCNIFMAKVADESCPECEAPIDEELEIKTMYEAPDGTHWSIEAEAEEWMDPVNVAARERKHAEARAELESHLAERREKIAKQTEENLPYFRELRAKLPEDWRVYRDLHYQIGHMERDPDLLGGEPTIYIDFIEMVRLVLGESHEVLESIEIMEDYELPHQVRGEVFERILEQVETKLSEAGVLEVFDHIKYASAGGAVSYPAGPAVRALLKVLSAEDDYPGMNEGPWA